MKAWLRWLLRPLVPARMKYYQDGELRQHYVGYLESPWIGIVCFIRADGTRQYSW